MRHGSPLPSSNSPPPSIPTQQPITPLSGQSVQGFPQTNPGLPLGNVNLSALFGAGIPVVVAGVHLIGQTSVIVDTNLFTPPADGQYEIEVILTDTTTGISGTMTTTITWTDYNGVQTFTSAALNVASVGEVDFVKSIYAKSSAPIKYRVDLTSILGSPQFAIDIKLLRLS